MKTHILSLSVALLFLGMTQAADAACYADYKAKRDNPLRLQYGVAEVSDAICNAPAAVFSDIKARIAKDGWQLLTIVSIFGPEGLSSRKQSAGKYFLRY